MKEDYFLRNEIFSRYGAVKRARGCFLYTAKNVRLTDLYLDGGRAILGWGGGSAFTMLKNALSRGITGSYITDYSYRLEKAVSDLLSSPRKVFAFPSKKLALETALKLFPENTSFWKPWLPSSPEWEKVDALLLELPFAWFPETVLLALKKDFPESSLPGTINLSAPMEAALSRSCYDTKAALLDRSEKDWFLWDKDLTPYWQRRGPYLYIKKDVIKEEDYSRFVLHMLDSGVVVNPHYTGASIVPYGADRGVFTALKNAPFA